MDNSKSYIWKFHTLVRQALTGFLLLLSLAVLAEKQGRGHPELTEQAALFEFPEVCFENWDGYWYSAKACVVGAYTEDMKEAALFDGASQANDFGIRECSSSAQIQTEISKLETWQCRFREMHQFIKARN